MPPQREPPLPEALGARRIAGLLAEHTGEPVSSADIDELVNQGHLVAVDYYKGWPLYSTVAALGPRCLPGAVGGRRAGGVGGGEPAP